ncbi:hypothetical protein RB653_000305 [Dictyostelium firmibasis]|uniref:Uncharacterized protein n=1 Tax=Dictyostelium firmibasis TaxID=79012 RepID=A0AAN7TV18_9MYCE
MEMNPQTL